MSDPKGPTSPDSDPEESQPAGENSTPESSESEKEQKLDPELEEGQQDTSPPPEEAPEPKAGKESDEESVLGSEEEREQELGGRMTFLEHLDEFRKRIMYSFGSIIVTFVLCWIFREQIFEFLAIPIKGVVEKLVVIKPTEPFTIYLKVSFVAAIFVASPFVLLQVWMFIAPGLYRREKRYALPFLLSSTMLFVLGGLFAYYVVLPPALNFLLREFGANFQHMITAVEFFDFEMLIVIGMGVVFQLPVLVAFLSIFGLITPGFLWRNFRYAVLIITIIAAIISPTTDPFNLFLWSGPMMILYLLSIGISWVFKRRREREWRR
jgi:sec-independent protein translocase protein TatC